MTDLHWKGIRELAETDTRERIQIKEEYNTHRTKVWVRVSGHHSIPWVHPGAKKLASAAKTAWDSMALPFSQLFYLTTREDWRTIRTEGIKAGHSFIHLKQDIPDHYGLRSGTLFLASCGCHQRACGHKVRRVVLRSSYWRDLDYRRLQWLHRSTDISLLLLPFSGSTKLSVGHHEPWLRPRDPRKRKESRHLIPD
ncbi:uncharacterized protein EV420DRAFT_482861 [Desarmillaria tabescens]|uniref:Uncharacterized protein n=1 Tax=Armillaria tabescens TaxID=1929756 RepID=A0AA39KB56_ARMTA|nr:uncharacterized protein EV420DRAFT_482861 [Desarmillaria tabescens]KAK0457855.1 hypothetical protein EV420DRAFT_482861 [Desarmillaria tabescens]